MNFDVAPYRPYFFPHSFFSSLQLEESIIILLCEVVYNKKYVYHDVFHRK